MHSPSSTQFMDELPDDMGIRTPEETIPQKPRERPPVEYIQLGSLKVPRVWIGLWQLSSAQWGAPPIHRVKEEMEHLIETGYNAFDMADHYGSAEMVFGKVRSSLPDPNSVIGATKWCIFKPCPNEDGIWGMQDAVSAVQKSRSRMEMDHVDLLQFHWNAYTDAQYIEVIRFLEAMRYDPAQGPSGDKVIKEIGLVNFDTTRLDQICTALPGVVVSNQVQFSLIDSRPLKEMAQVCRKHGVKLLTYGTLCGGLLSEAFLDRSSPAPYASLENPSQRKYVDVITKVWGSWDLFQELLETLREIGVRHNGRSIANVATRWVLDHDFVGAAIVGARLGVSNHSGDNDRIYGFTLTPEDKAQIQGILDRSNGLDRLFSSLGDCGGEYRK